MDNAGNYFCPICLCTFEGVHYDFCERLQEEDEKWILYDTGEDFLAAMDKIITEGRGGRGK